MPPRPARPGPDLPRRWRASQRLGLVTLGIVAPTNARDPQLVVVARKGLQVSHITSRPRVDDHVFHARTGDQVAEDISGIGYVAATARIDSKIQGVVAPRKPPRLRIIRRGRGDARAQNAGFCILVHGPRASLYNCLV